jgi:DNA repair protein RadC
MTNRQLIELLLGPARTAKPRPSAERAARRLLGATTDLDALARLAPTLLAEHAGVDLSLVLRVQAAFELGRRRLSERRQRTLIDSLDAVVAWARPQLLGLDHEEVWLLCLDGRNRMRSSQRISQGGMHGCALTSRDILCPALREGASAIVLVHNHPSGDPMPSDADLRMTSQVDVACATVGMPLLDHVIVAWDGASSLLELGAIGSNADAQR